MAEAAAPVASSAPPAPAPPSAPTDNSSSKGKGRAKGRQGQYSKQGKRFNRRDRTEAAKKVIHKVVVRRLPAKLPEAVMIRLLEPFKDEYDDFYFIVGDPTMKTNQFARAYVKFKTSDGALRFARAFDGHLFKNADGDEHRAVVEMAPLLKMPNHNRKVDKHAGTLSEDPEFIAFSEQLALPPETRESAEKWLEKHLAKLEAEKDSPGPTTALIDFLAAKQEARRQALKAKSQAAKAAKNSKRTKAKQGVVPKAIAKRAQVAPAIPSGSGSEKPSEPPKREKKPPKKSKKPTKKLQQTDKESPGETQATKSISGYDGKPGSAPAKNSKAKQAQGGHDARQDQPKGGRASKTRGKSGGDGGEESSRSRPDLQVYRPGRARGGGRGRSGAGDVGEAGRGRGSG